MKKFFVLLFMLTCFSFVDHGNAGTIQPNGIYQGDLYKFIRAANHKMRNTMIGNVDLQLGTASRNIGTNITANYIADGIVCTFNVTRNLGVINVGGIASVPVQGASVTRNYLFHINRSGTFYVTYSANGTYPDGVSGYAPFALLSVGTAANGSYTLGSTNLGSTSVNYTITPVGTIPSGNYGVQLSY